MGAQNGTGNGEVRDTLILGQTSQGTEIHASLLRLTRYGVSFEIYNPGMVLRTSEVLHDFKILLNGSSVYAGRAVIRNLVNTGSVLVCEATLDDSWLEKNALARNGHGDKGSFAEFLEQWQKIYRVRPEFKVVVADMQAFLTELRMWLEKMELEIRSAPAGDRSDIERNMANDLGRSTTPVLTRLFEKLENVLEGVEKELQPVHQTFGKRQLHPMLLCSPFLYRTFSKPLGYAGDYEMVNMMMRDPLEGGSLYSKIVNLWFLQQPPAEAHRNRINYLVQQISESAMRAQRAHQTARILSVGCGPAHEVQRFLRDSHLANHASFTLLDFNAETLTHAQTVLENIRGRNQLHTELKFVKKSVHHILKETGRRVERSAADGYDLIYCAGLFDYLTDSVCRKLTSIFYDWLAPGGLLITTNVHASNPRRLTMDYIMEWHLNYRNTAEFEALKPDAASDDLCITKSDETGVNIYFETRRPIGA